MRKDHSDTPAITANSAWRIGIVAAPYYKEETDSLVSEAKRVLIEVGIKEGNISLHEVPGSWEIPVVAKALAAAKKVDALIGFGTIVQGETQHARLLAEGVTHAMMRIQLDHQMPFGFEILYVDNMEQARARAFGEHNKGREAALAVLKTLSELEKMR